MATQAERLQNAFHAYEKSIGKPGSPRAAVEWALRSGLLSEPTLDPIAELTSNMARALRAETRVDANGIEYRANQAVKFTNDGGVQESLWADIDRNSTSRDFVVESFGQRRKGIVDDCVKLKADVDHYNTANPRAEPVQMVFDFSEDIAEREAMREAHNEAA